MANTLPNGSDTMTYHTEFPDFTLDVEIPAGFIDQSWHNDAMPKFERTLPDGRTMTLWVDYLDPALSEFGNFPTHKRFTLVIGTDDQRWTGAETELTYTNNWQDILNAIQDHAQ